LHAQKVVKNLKPRGSLTQELPTKLKIKKSQGIINAQLPTDF